MKEHSVVAEMVDQNTGDRYFPGQTFTPADEEQAARLIKSGCLREGTDGAAKQRDQINNDGLFDQSVDDLKKLAETEKVDLGTATKKADIITAIRAARAV